MQPLIVNTLPEHQWRDFVERHPHGNVFHTPDMFQVFAQTKGHRPTLWAAVDDNGEVQALLIPVELTLFDGFLRRFTSRAVVYGSVLCNPGPSGEKALEVLLESYVRAAGSEVLFTELRNLSDMSAVQPTLRKCGFAFEDHLNFLIRLGRPVGQIMERVAYNTRKQIRRGLRRGTMVVEEVVSRDGIAACYELLRQTYAAACVPLPDRSLIEAAFDTLYPKGMVRFVLARVGDVYVGTSIELLYKDIVYGWFGGVNREYSRYTPSEIIMWHVLMHSAEDGYMVYDFGGAGKPGEKYGVRDFKAKFGGTLVCFGRNVYVHSPGLLRLSRLGYGVYRQLKRAHPKRL